MIYQIKISIKKLSGNLVYSGIHWTKRNKHKNQYALLCNGFKKLEPINDIIDIKYDFRFIKNALDSENCFYMAKMITDCLVKNKVIKDDSPKYVNDVTYNSKRDTTTKEDYVIITIKKAGD